MEKQMNNTAKEVRENKVTTGLNMNPSSQLLNDATKSILINDSTLSINRSETILCSLLTNSNSTPNLKRNVTTNGESRESDKNELMMLFENDNNNTITVKTEKSNKIDFSLKSNKAATMSRSPPISRPDAKTEVEDENKNGFPGFPCKSLYGSIGFNDSYLNDNPVKKEESRIPVENDFRDILECSQFMRTEKKQYSNDAVNLDELNLSVSKILNSAKTYMEENEIVSNSSPTDGPCSKTFVVNEDHSYHLPPLLGNGNILEIKKPNEVIDTDEQNNSAENMCTTGLNCVPLNKNELENNSASGVCTKLQISKNGTNAVRSSGTQTRNQNEPVLTANNPLTVESSDHANISSNPSLVVEKTCNNEKNQIITAANCQARIGPMKTDDTLLSTETLALEKHRQLQTFPQTDSSFMNGEVKSQTVKTEETHVNQSPDLKAAGVLESVENKLQNTSNEKSDNKDLKIHESSVEEAPFVVETSYDCNECGAKLKTQNSLFTHKKMHLSGAVVTATAKKRKLEIIKIDEVSKELKRKRGRPKLVKTENSTEKEGVKLVKTENGTEKERPKLVISESSTETISLLKENIPKKVLRNRAQSDEITQPKLKHNAKAVKENKISSNNKAPKNKRSPKIQEPVLTKIVSNKPKITLRSENCTYSNKTAVNIESVKPKGKARNCYSSSAASNLLRKFACPDCGAKFKRNDHMKRHQLLHSEKSFQCSVCGMKFYRGDKLKLHTLRHHPVKASKKVNAKLVADSKLVTNAKMVASAKLIAKAKLPNKSVECHKCGIQFLRIVPPKTDKAGQSRRKTSCCISCGAKMKDENN